MSNILSASQSLGSNPAEYFFAVSAARDRCNSLVYCITYRKKIQVRGGGSSHCPEGEGGHCPEHTAKPKGSLWGSLRIYKIKPLYRRVNVIG